MNAKPLSVAERESLVKKALSLPDNEGFTKDFLEGSDDDELRMWADDFSPEEKTERMLDWDSEDWTEGDKSRAERAGLSAK